MKRVPFGAAVSTVGLGLIAWYALPWVRDESGSLALDFLFISLWVMASLAASWFQVALFLSERAAGEHGEDQPSGIAGSWKSSLPMVGVLLPVLAANLYWSNLVAGDFWFAHYSRIGAYATAFRAEDPETRRWAIERTAEMSRRDVLDLVDEVGRLAATDPEPGVRTLAVAALGHLARRMRVAMATLDAHGSRTGAWEVELFRKVKRLLGDPAAMARDVKDEGRLAWIYAVGGLGDRSAVPILARIVGDRGSGEDEIVAAVCALADMMYPEVLDALGPLLEADRGIPTVYAAWAAGLVVSGALSRPGFKAEPGTPVARTQQRLARSLVSLGLQAQCAYLRYFPRIGDAGMTDTLVELTRTPGFLLRCERLERRPWFGPPEPVVAGGDFYLLVLNAMASVAIGNERLIRFLEDAARDERFPPEVREAMDGIARRAAQAGG